MTEKHARMAANAGILPNPGVDNPFNNYASIGPESLDGTAVERVPVPEKPRARDIPVGAVPALEILHRTGRKVSFYVTPEGMVGRAHYPNPDQSEIDTIAHVITSLVNGDPGGFWNSQLRSLLVAGDWTRIRGNGPGI